MDTWGVDYALLDENDRAIGGVYSYRDARTEKTVPEVHGGNAVCGALRKDGNSV